MDESRWGEGETWRRGNRKRIRRSRRAGLSLPVTPSPRLPVLILVPSKTPLLPACGGANIAPHPSSTVRTKLVPGDFSRTGISGIIFGRILLTHRTLEAQDGGPS